MNQPLVSIIIPTYNHELYLEEAIISVLDQKVSFPIEILIGDDASQDNTYRIANKYSRKYPSIFKIYSNTKNAGIARNWERLLRMSKGKYISFLEGDDYWTIPNKLDIQVSFLEKNPDYSICLHNCLVTTENSNKVHEWPGPNHNQTSELRDIIKFGSGGATCSIVISQLVVNNLPSWFKELPSVDWALQMFATRMGKMKYFPEVMGVYRRHSQGCTAVKNSNDLVRIFDIGGVQLIKRFDEFFNYEFHEETEYTLMNYFYPNLLKAYSFPKDRKMISSIARSIIKTDKFRRLPFKEKFKYQIFSRL